MSLILFSWPVNGHFRFAWSVNHDVFSFRDSWIYDYIFPYSSRGKWFSIFPYPWNMHLLTWALWTKQLLREYFFFFEHFSIFKARKLYQTRCKTCLTRLWMENSKHSYSVWYLASLSRCVTHAISMHQNEFWGIHFSNDCIYLFCEKWI